MESICQYQIIVVTQNEEPQDHTSKYYPQGYPLAPILRLIATNFMRQTKTRYHYTLTEAQNPTFAGGIDAWHIAMKDSVVKIFNIINDIREENLNQVSMQACYQQKGDISIRRDLIESLNNSINNLDHNRSETWLVAKKCININNAVVYGQLQSNLLRATSTINAYLIQQKPDELYWYIYSLLSVQDFVSIEEDRLIVLNYFAFEEVLTDQISLDMVSARVQGIVNLKEYTHFNSYCNFTYTSETRASRTLAATLSNIQVGYTKAMVSASNICKKENGAEAIKSFYCALLLKAYHWDKMRSADELKAKTDVDILAYVTNKGALVNAQIQFIDRILDKYALASKDDRFSTQNFKNTLFTIASSQYVMHSISNPDGNLDYSIGNAMSILFLDRPNPELTAIFPNFAQEIQRTNFVYKPFYVSDLFYLISRGGQRQTNHQSYIQCLAHILYGFHIQSKQAKDKKSGSKRVIDFVSRHSSQVQAYYKGTLQEASTTISLLFSHVESITVTGQTNIILGQLNMRRIIQQMSLEISQIESPVVLALLARQLQQT